MNSYIIIKDANFYTVEKQVNDLIEQGYVPAGGITMNQHDEYLQAMVVLKFK